MRSKLESEVVLTAMLDSVRAKYRENAYKWHWEAKSLLHRGHCRCSIHYRSQMSDQKFIKLHKMAHYLEMGYNRKPHATNY